MVSAPAAANIIEGVLLSLITKVGFRCCFESDASAALDADNCTLLGALDKGLKTAVETMHNTNISDADARIRPCNIHHEP